MDEEVNALGHGAWRDYQQIAISPKVPDLR